MPSGVQEYDRSPGVHTINCHTCNQPKGPEGQKLKKCARCLNIFYCTVACQRANWNDHKEYCRKGRPVDPAMSARLDKMLGELCKESGIELEEVDEYGGNDPAMAGPTTEEMEAMGWTKENGWGEKKKPKETAASAPDVPTSTNRAQHWGESAWDIPGPRSLANFATYRPFSNNVSSLIAHLPGDYLHNIPEDRAFDMLIDAFHIYRGDEWLRGNLKASYIHDDPLPFFKAILDRAETREGIMPSWWCAEKREELVSAADIVARLATIRRGTIQERYGDPEIENKLRVLAEKMKLDGLIEGLTEHLEPPYVPTAEDFGRWIAEGATRAPGTDGAPADSTLSQPSTTNTGSPIASPSYHYLHDIPENQALSILSDAFKLRSWDDRYLEDQIKIEQFLDKAESTPGILPSWWNAEKRSECQRMSLGTELVVCFEAALEQRHKDKTMPNKLRALTEKIFANEI